MELLKANNHPLVQAADDYGYAILKLVWIRDDLSNYLLFGFLELIPKEYPIKTPMPLEEKRIGNKGRKYIYIQSFIIRNVETALDWYNQCRTGTVTLPSVENEKINISGTTTLISNGFAEEPQWPQLVVGSEVFTTFGIVRKHHLLQPNIHQEVNEAIGNLKTKEWLDDKLSFDISEYQEYIGSVNLSAPNPIYRSLDWPFYKEGSNEIQIYRFHPRRGKSVAGLQLIVFEKRPTGVSTFTTIELKKNTVKLEYIGNIEQTGLAVVDKDRGLLEWMKPYPYIRQISSTITIGGREKIIAVPATRNGKSGSSYSVFETPKAPPSSIVGELVDNPAASILRQANSRRKVASTSKQYDQRWFHGQQDEAESYIRDLVGKAKNRVIIVDPYFATRELFSFALATKYEGVNVTILTSDEAMNFEDKIDDAKTAGFMLYDQLKKFKSDNKSKIQLDLFNVFVMTGKKSEIHDRFIITDDEVRLSGNSLNDIGKRAGVIVKLPDPELIIPRIESIMSSDKCIPIEKWREMQ